MGSSDQACEHVPERAPEHTIVARGAYALVREVQELLARAEIPAEIVRPSGHHGG